MSKHVLVTGGNSGIGLALCKLLIKDHSCHVYHGSRDTSRGAAALKTILDDVPDKTDKIEMLQIDVGNDDSCTSAAQVLEVSLQISISLLRLISHNLRQFLLCTSAMYL